MEIRVAQFENTKDALSWKQSVQSSARVVKPGFGLLTIKLQALHHHGNFSRTASLIEQGETGRAIKPGEGGDNSRGAVA
jgi:hypothetical protein